MFVLLFYFIFMPFTMSCFCFSIYMTDCFENLIRQCIDLADMSKELEQRQHMEDF